MMRRIYGVTLFLIFINCAAFTQVNHWETALFPTDDCVYTIPTSNTPIDWFTESFDDGAWTAGIGGIGYGDGDDETIIDRTNAVFIRYTFDIVNVSEISRAILDADYDDGFVAYLNGEEVARRFITEPFPSYNASATQLNEANLYQGLAPESFTFFEEDVMQLFKNGENVLAVQVHNYDGLNSSDLSSNFYLHLGINNESQNYEPTPSWFQGTVENFTSPLPILRVYTNEEIVDEPKVIARLEVVNHLDGSLNQSSEAATGYNGPIGIEKRGQSSLGLFPKVGYGFETIDENGLDIDTTILGFPLEEDWILSGPYSDKTLMRNVLAYHLANSAGAYASRTKYLELIINDSYQGIYLLMEKIKRDKNRVDIANLKEEDIDGDELTGGYVFKIDKGEADWFSQYQLWDNPGYLSFQYVSPNRNTINTQQRNYIKSYVDSFEMAIRSADFHYDGKRYDEFIDLESFADHFILKELAKDVDAYRISSYYHKKKDSNGGKIHAGPAWDFNIAFGNINYCGGEGISGWMYYVNCGPIPFWWFRLIDDQKFRDILHCRWDELKEGAFSVENIHAFIDEQALVLDPALGRNFDKWPVLDQYIWPNAVQPGSFEGEVEYLKNWIADRHAWLEVNMPGSCVIQNVEEKIGLDDQVQIFPNPFDDEIRIEIYNSLKIKNIRIFDTLGKLVYQQRLNNNFVVIDLNRLNVGLFQATFELEDGVRFSKKIIKQ